MLNRNAPRVAALLAPACLVATLAFVPAAMLLAQDAKQPRRDQVAGAKKDANLTSQLDEPIRLAQKAREKFRTIQDYSCMLVKRERVGGQMLPMEFIQMKTRNRPFGIYMKWQQPYDGREAIFAEGQYSGKLMVHSTGVEKVVGGTVALDPRGEMAMENSRHAITEAGLGNLIEQLNTRWEAERRLGQSQAEIRDNAKVDNRVCWCVKMVHPNDPRHYTYYRARVFFDKETSLPIRFEAYDWPRRGGAADGDLVEEYTYRDLKFNVSLSSADFSTDNPKYNFGRL